MKKFFLSAFSVILILLLLILCTTFRKYDEAILPYYDYETGLYGYCTEDGEIRIPPRFTLAGAFSENGLAPAKSPQYPDGYVNMPWLWGYIDKTGEYVIERKEYINSEPFGERDVVRVSTYDNKWGLMNSHGDIVANLEYDYIFEFSENGLATVVTEDGNYGCINEKGEIVIEPSFDYISPFGKNGLAPASVDGKYGYINENGEYVIEPQFDNAYIFCDDGLARAAIGIERDQRWGFIDDTGKFVIEPSFKWVEDFADNGLARFKDSEQYDELYEMYLYGKTGYINRLGEVVIKPQFDFAYGFSENGLAAAESGYMNWGFINAEGKFVIDAKFYLVNYNSFENCGLAAVSEMSDDGIKYGYINEKGEYVIKPQFDGAEEFNPDGFARVSYLKNPVDEFETGRPEMIYFYINTNGEIIAPK